MSKKTQGPHIPGYFSHSFKLRGQSLFATVQFAPSTDDSHTATWWISSDWNISFPTLLFTMEYSVETQEQESMKSQAEVFAKRYLEPMSVEGFSSKGLQSRAGENTPEVLEDLLHEHIDFYSKSRLNRNWFNPSLELSYWYRLAKGFAVKNPVKFLAGFFSLPESTITRRLTRLRDIGVLPKKDQTTRNANEK